MSEPKVEAPVSVSASLVGVKGDAYEIKVLGVPEYYISESDRQAVYRVRVNDKILNKK